MKAPAKTLTLSERIVRLLKQQKGAKLTLADIMDKLKLAGAQTGEGWANTAKMCFDLSKLCGHNKILSGYDRGEPVYWIEPPKEDSV